MVKQRMSSVDVAGEVACLRQKCIGLRVANIYDLNAKVVWQLSVMPAGDSMHAMQCTWACMVPCGSAQGMLACRCWIDTLPYTNGGSSHQMQGRNVPDIYSIDSGYCIHLHLFQVCWFLAQ